MAFPINVSAIFLICAYVVVAIKSNKIQPLYENVVKNSPNRRLPDRSPPKSDAGSQPHYCGTPTRLRQPLNRFAPYMQPDVSETDDRRIQRDVSAAGSAVYFTGRSDTLSYVPFSNSGPHEDRARNPRHRLTVSLWVKPAGGQKTPAVIIGMLDTCRGGGNQWTWAVGIDTQADPNKDARYFFSLVTDRSPVGSSVRATVLYTAETWTHLAATYDGQRLTLYVNGAKVATGRGETGPMFSEVLLQCKQLVLGGSINDDNVYRGAVDEVTMWSTTLNHRQLRDIMQGETDTDDQHVVVREDFNGDWGNWIMAADTQPSAIPSDIARERHRLVAVVPSCGATVCDSAVVADSYARVAALRSLKTLRYRMIVVAEDDGTNPIISSEDVMMKHAMVSEAFQPHNITWQLSQLHVRNSSLRHRRVLSKCELHKVGDGSCDTECWLNVTGDDGGDCRIDVLCAKKLKGNGECNDNCNTEVNEYDEGDCCDPRLTDVTVTCFDPKSPYRNYVTVDELKELAPSDSGSYLNVYFANFANPGLKGMATLPWDMDVDSLNGWTFLQTDPCNSPATSETIIHEMGHNLGLWHVHRGAECDDDDCRETRASKTHGDLVSDTNPTLTSSLCRDPSPCEIPSCFQEANFTDTAFRNYMSYADGDCTDHFTPQQEARMHCYIDLVCSSWLAHQDNVYTLSPSASPVLPLSPRVVSERLPDHRGPAARQVTLSWVAPVSQFDTDDRGDADPGSAGICRDCSRSNQLAQYASTARFSSPRMRHGDLASWLKSTGPPAAGVKCEIEDKHTWAAVSSYTICEDCCLELGFATAVVPSKLIFWAYHNTAGGIRNLELKYRDGSVRSLGPVDMFCDMPFTLRLSHINNKVQAIRIYPKRRYFSLDAVQLVSVADWPGCESCQPLSYRVVREPPFPGGESTNISPTTVFTDEDVDSDTSYSYRIQAFQGGRSSELTSPLVHRLGQAFCGNGRIERNEECDDMNTVDGDGCSLDCQVEEGFVCEGESSICSHVTCLASTDEPPTDYYPSDADIEFDDQWVESAVANDLFQNNYNPVSALYGPPSTAHCGSRLDTGHGWYSDDSYDLADKNFWIKVHFARAVVATAVIVHLSGDGNQYRSDPKELTVELLGPDGESITQLLTTRIASCEANPIHFNVVHDLSLPFVHTQSVRIRPSSDYIAISAVLLRSRRSLDPVTVSSCRPDQLYHPSIGRCLSYPYTWTECGALAVPHAIVSCTGKREGDYCKVTCDKGYRGLNAGNLMKCVGGEWQGPDMACTPVNCGKLSPPYAEILCSGPTTYGEQCKLKCIQPAKMQGTVKNITCMADGRYSLPEAYCQVVCGTPIVPNAMLSSPHCQTGTYNVGTVCKFECIPGYYTIGTFSKRRQSQKLKYRCTKDAVWVGARCVPVTCRPPPIIFDGLYTCTNRFNYNSECQLRCDQENGEANDEVLAVNNIRCLQDPEEPDRGIWDGEFTLCPSFQGSCEPPQMTNSGVELSCRNGYTIGSQCAVHCSLLSNREPALLSGNSSSTSVRVWNTSDHTIICSRQRHWLPRPNQVTCVQKCSQQYIGDSICQSSNNRAYCSWDGGDCCASTNVHGYVLSMNSDPQCSDPNAEENQHSNGSHRKDRHR